MRTNIRFRDESGNVISIDEVKPVSPIQALLDFSLVLLAIGILIEVVQQLF